MKNIPDLSRTEYDILRVLWKNGRQTVREVHDLLQPTHGWAYTTTKTMMDRMAGKGLLNRAEFHGVYLYQPLISRPRGMARLVQFLAERVFETDTGSVVAMFADASTLPPEELRDLETILRELEAEESGHDRS